jgi:uncharacterized membrane protein YdcZ (DUF606 family)
MNTGWIIPFIILGGALQTCGDAMNGQLNKHMVNPWLASAISFALITFFFIGAFLILPQPVRSPSSSGRITAYTDRTRKSGLCPDWRPSARNPQRMG